MESDARYNTPKSKFKISIIVLTWNLLPLTNECIRSVMKNTKNPYELIFVDNCSTDGTVSWLEGLCEYHNKNKFCEDVKVVIGSKQRGYAESINKAIGMVAEDSKHIVLLNNDTIVAEGWDYWPVSILECNENIWAISPTTNMCGNPAQRGNPDWDANYFIYVPDINFVSAFIRKEAFEKLGGLDERFKSGFEDTDFCKRISLSGHNIAVCRKSFVYHVGSQTLKANYNEQALYAEGQKKFNEKWSGKQ